jgi:hypothetical protein
VARQRFAATGKDWEFYSRQYQSDSDDEPMVEPDVSFGNSDQTAPESDEDETTIDEQNARLLPQPKQPIIGGSTSQLITVVNGSFLLNLPLVNHEHRKLAGKLIAATTPEGHTVFLESGERDPQILAEEPDADYGPGLKYFEVWPLGPIVLHLAVLGIIFCFARWPIFGTPLLLPAAPASDFGKHVRALGKLLSRTKDKAFAASRVEHYQAKKRES